MTVEPFDREPVELSDLINRVLDKGAVIAGSVTISVADIDLIQLDLTIVLTALETARSTERRKREVREVERHGPPGHSPRGARPGHDGGGSGG